MARAVPFFVFAGILTATSPSWAQTWRPERPYRGLFANEEAADQSLTASVSLGAGYDDNLQAEAQGRDDVLTDGTRQGGRFAAVSGTLAYALSRPSVTIGANLGMGIRFYPSVNTSTLRATTGSVSVGVPLNSRLSWSARATAAHQPLVTSELFAQGPEPPRPEPPTSELDMADSGDLYLSYSINTGVSYRLSQRTSFGASYAYRSASGYRFISRQAGASLSHALGRGLSLRAGYGYSVAQQADSEKTPVHGADAGVDYGRALSFSRRTRLSFSTGSTATTDGNEWSYMLTGGLNLHHEIGRTWLAWTTYGRRLVIHETFIEPVLSDGVSFGLAGLLSRHWQVASGGQVAFGRVGVPQDSPRFRNYHVGVTVMYGLNRYLGLGATYAYYHHRFDDQVVLPPGVRHRLGRNSILGGLSLWAPLIQRGRRG
jgi:hypothetical protein